MPLHPVHAATALILELELELKLELKLEILRISCQNAYSHQTWHGIDLMRGPHPPSHMTF